MMKPPFNTGHPMDLIIPLKRLPEQPAWMPFSRLLAIFIVFLALATVARAEIIGIESFNYGDGTQINGQSGGSFWGATNGASASAWIQTSGTPVVFGGQFINDTTGQAAVRAYRANEASGVVSSGTLYYRVTLTTSSSLPDCFGVSAFASTAGGERVFFGKNNGAANFGLTVVGGAVTNSSLAVQANHTYTLVAAVDYDHHLASLWVNPDLSQPEANNVPVATAAFNSGSSEALRLANCSHGQVAWDDLVVATTWADLGAVTPVIQVTTITDEDNGWLGGGLGVSLREAVDYSPPGTRITFLPALESATITLTNQIDVLNTLTIDASALSGGITLSGNNHSRIFNIGLDTVHNRDGNGQLNVTLNSLILNNGSAHPENQTLLEYSGGAIFNYSEHLTLNECRLENNQATTPPPQAGFYPTGGGIENYLGTLTVSNCEFIGNAAKFGGAIDNHGGSFLVDHCIFSNNSAATNGGAIYNFPYDFYSASGMVKSCNFFANVAMLGGAVDNDHGLLLADHSTFDSNVATNAVTAAGGAIYNNAGTNIFSHCTFAANSAASIGGAIENFGGLLRADNSTFSANYAVHLGGAIINDGINVGAAFLADNCTFAGNSASTSGGAIENIRSGTNALNNCTLTGNTAIGSVGGGIDNDGSSTLFLTNTIVAGNTAGASGPNISGAFSGANNFTNGDPQLSSLGDYGGSTQTMPPLAGSPAIDAGNDSVTGFLATDQRGYSRLVGSHVDIGAAEYQPALTVTSSADSGTGSLRDAVAAVAPGGEVTFASVLDGQTLTLTGGQINILTNLTIDASSLTHGISLSGNHHSPVFIVSFSANVILDSLTLTNGQGGGIFNYGTLTANNSTFASNSASSGGGIYNDSGAVVTVNNCTIANNTASNGGGGIYNDGTLTANNSTFTGNSATHDGGGGIYNNGGTLFLTNTIVAGNIATSGTNIFGSFSGANNLTNGDPQLAPLGFYGGPTQTQPPLAGSPAIDAGTKSVSSFLLTDQRGYSRHAGGHVDIGAVEFQPALMVTSSVDSGTDSLRTAVAAIGDGGVITFAPALNGYNLPLTDGQIIIDHDLTIDGSGLTNGVTLHGNGNSRLFEVESNVNLTLDSLTLANGVASSGDGGGILNYGSLTANKSTFTGNTADYLGGAIYSFGVTATVAATNCTFAGNAAADGGALVNSGKKCP